MLIKHCCSMIWTRHLECSTMGNVGRNPNLPCIMIKVLHESLTSLWVALRSIYFGDHLYNQIPLLCSSFSPSDNACYFARQDLWTWRWIRWLKTFGVKARQLILEPSTLCHMLTFVWTWWAVAKWPWIHRVDKARVWSWHRRYIPCSHSEFHFTSSP